MIPFLFNENRFSFFVVNHLLVGQLCTNPKSYRSLLSCLKVTQCLTSEIRNAPLYNSCSLPIQQQDDCQHPQNANPDGSTLESTGKRTGRPFGGGKRKDTARKTRTKEFIEKVQAIIDETLQRPIRQIARDLGVSHTTVNTCVKEDLKCRSYRRQTSQILTEKTKNLRLIKSVMSPPPQPEPAGLLHLVIRRKHHQHDLLQHQSQLDRCHSLSIHRAPAVTCGKGMLPVSGSVSRR